ncbi:DNA repair protein RadA [bacterium]|nr:DNA repair protein RadA [bacterium]
MAKAKISFVCAQCGHREGRWFGRCSACGAWNSAEEELSTEPVRGVAGRASRSAAPLLSSSAGPERSRWTGRLGDLDRVLGGGLVPGSSVLLGGEPGIGKSTLLLSALDRWIAGGARGLYISGEESAAQCRLRAARIGVSSGDLLFLAETRLEEILGQLEAVRPDVLVLDSIQSVYHEAIPSGPGSIVQVRECASHLVRAAKERDCALILVGHVTKEGQLAGPRLLEHLVDTVLYMEGDAGHHYILVRAVKHRFGSTSEVAIFEMAEQGLVPVSETASLFLNSQHADAPGQVITVSMAGSRPFFFELQALTSPNAGFGAPRRTANGMDVNRLAMLLAVLERHGGLHFSTQDVYANVVGGFRTEETAADLAWVAALAGSLLSRSWGRDTVIFGEVGLGGEIRSVAQADRRVIEIENLGFRRAILPKDAKLGRATGRLLLEAVGTLGELLRLL